VTRQKLNDAYVSAEGTTQSGLAHLRLPFAMRPTLAAYLDHHGLHLLSGLVPTPGMVYAIMFLVLALVFTRRARFAGMSASHAINLVVVVGLAAAIGAHVFRLVVTGDWHRLPISRWLSEGGTASWGDYVFGIVAVVGYAWWARLSAWLWLDLAVSVQPLGEMIGRWSCWLAGDDFGRITNVPWAIRFPAGSLAWNEHVSRGLIPATAPWSLPVHPQQFYLMLNAALLFAVITVVWRRKRLQPGLTLAVFLLLYGVSRFCVEFFRDPVAGGAAVGLSASQWMCLMFVAAGGMITIARRHAWNHPPD